jgi:hypothetical protein
VLALASTSKQDAALFAEMLSQPNDGRYIALEMTRQGSSCPKTPAPEERARRLSPLL